MYLCMYPYNLNHSWGASYRSVSSPVMVTSLCVGVPVAREKKEAAAAQPPERKNETAVTYVC